MSISLYDFIFWYWQWFRLFLHIMCQYNFLSPSFVSFFFEALQTSEWLIFMLLVIEFTVIFFDFSTLSDSLSGYEQTFCENNLQLMELQFYINNIARCLGMVVLLSERRQDHQFNTLIDCSSLFTGRLSTNHNIIKQASGI